MNQQLTIINAKLEEKHQLLRSYKASLREQSEQQLIDACNEADVNPGNSKMSALYALFLLKRRQIGIDDLQACKADIEEAEGTTNICEFRKLPSKMDKKA